MPQVHVHPVVPVVDRDVLPVVAVVVGGVVDQHGHAAEFVDRPSACNLQRLDVEQVDLVEDRGVRCFGAALDRGVGVVGVDVDERDLAALAGEVLDGGAADAVSATGDEHGAVDERRVAGVVLDVHWCFLDVHGVS